MQNCRHSRATQGGFSQWPSPLMAGCWRPAPVMRLWFWNPATGALRETLNTLGLVTELEFSQDGWYLHTNVGWMKIQPRCGILIPNTSNTISEISVSHGWIALNGKNVLWLPPEARHSCSTIRSNTLSIGHILHIRPG